eukprot:CAMPEP_0118923330 /NCGR_PEP_ID=MMETSP1169-20130426/1896_1 /TAXON_ID=36882 /ORGANISM="Pyramimonas obovata, Strain CCMP722" /LENGTH=474 /DNA_ID=CAMNT_0006864301 /DNA_START=47 /DNA_END=1471 /DNA_ORIENTATION=+
MYAIASHAVSVPVIRTRSLQQRKPALCSRHVAPLASRNSSTISGLPVRLNRHVVATRPQQRQQNLRKVVTVSAAAAEEGSKLAPAGVLPEGPMLAAPVIAAMIVNATMGTAYTWAIFLTAFEGSLGISRGTLSFVFTIALSVFATVMFFGTGWHTKYPTHNMAALAMAMAGTGFFVAGFVPTFAALVIGFGLIFGPSMGIGYGISVGVANMAKTQKGLITGLIVAAFASTPVFMTPLIRASVLAHGPHATFMTMGKVMLAFAPVVWACYKFGKVQIPPPAKLSDDEEPIQTSTILTLFAAFGSGCMGGLMTIAHATGIITSFGGSAAQAAAAVQYGALGNWGGRIIAGAACDIVGPKTVLLIGALAAGASMLVSGILFPTNPIPMMVTIVILGLGYGCVMVAYVQLTRKMVGTSQFGKYFGRVFMAYGLGAFSGPYLAGYLFDKTGGYSQPILVAAGACILSAFLLTRLPAPRE